MDKKKLTLIFVWIPIILLGVINLLTVFTPEIGFDALWYHLTLPKLWLFKQQWFFDGGLLYYSAMPRLTETIFIPLIKLTDFIGPKLVQYLSGIGISIFIWKILTKQNISTTLKSLGVSLFYCTWLVSWQSGSAYIDLFRTLLETIALFYFTSGSWKKGGLFLGLAVGTKWFAIGSVFIYSFVFGFPLMIISFLLSLPWFIISFVYTSNPIYPIFSPVLNQSFLPLGTIIKNIFLLPLTITFPSDDFISPMVGILVVLSTLAIFSRHKIIRKVSLIGLMGAIFSVVINPPSSRFFLPFLPALVIASVYVVSLLKNSFQKFFIFLVIISSHLILGLRMIAIDKYFPFLLGRETQTEFLTRHSDRLPDTFIDSDNFVRDHISPGSKILIDKLHNLYYFPYNFDHTSWVKDHGDYDYFITKGAKPSEIKGDLLHTNSLGIQIYKLTK